GGGGGVKVWAKNNKKSRTPPKFNIKPEPHKKKKKKNKKTKKSFFFGGGALGVFRPRVFYPLLKKPFKI
ncbi:hypothetical protein, partial [Escherichia coli]|uniref:hypothetical protein n=1 Tax=Escherichia coli TaxID=562 RepID=UPI0021E727FA